MNHSMDVTPQGVTVDEIVASMGHMAWMDMKLVERQGYMQVTREPVGAWTGKLVRQRVLDQIVDRIKPGARFKAVLEAATEHRNRTEFTG